MSVLSKEKLHAQNLAFTRIEHAVRSEARRLLGKVCILCGMSELARSQGSWTSPKETFALTLDNCQHVSQRQELPRQRCQAAGNH